jgi:TPR repeat protein
MSTGAPSDAQGLGAGLVLKAAVALYHEQKYEQALQSFRQAAQLGKPAAMNWVGFMYNFGLGTKQSYAKAVKWYRRAEALGDPSAMYNLAVLFENGNGVVQDCAEAARLYRAG